MTFKSGQFVFSRLYDSQKLGGLLNEAKLLYATIAGLPILPDLASQLEEELIKRSIFGTAAIEGNPLSEKKVDELLTENKKAEEFQKHEKEIENLKQAYEIIRKTTPNPAMPFKLTEDLIKNIHILITVGIPYKGNNPGSYRNHLVKVGNQEHGGVYTPPKMFDDIKSLMQEFISWINAEEILTEDPAVRAALAHYYLGLIHPFGNGNGRTARIIESILLKSAGIRFVPHMLSNFYYQQIDNYFWAFSLTEKDKKNQVTPFLEFFLQGLVESLEQIKSRIIWMIRGLVLRNFYEALKNRKEITQRQYDLLLLLLGYNEQGFSRPELFNKTPFQILYRMVSQRTAYRDLNKLEAKKLLIQKNNQYVLNWHILEQAG